MNEENKSAESVGGNRKVVQWVVLVAVVAVIIWVAISSVNSNQPETSAEPIKIGVINPTSGPAGSVGEEVVNSMNLASSSRSNLSISYEDDQCDPKKALSAYMKLKTEGVRVFIVSCSGSVLALAAPAKQDGNLVLTAYAGSSEIRKTGDEVIRLIPDAVSIAGEMGKYVNALPETAKVGLLYESQDYSKSAALKLKEDLKTKVLVSDEFKSDDITFRTQVAKLKAAGINELLFIPTSDKAANLILKEMQTLKYTPHIIGDVNVCEYKLPLKEFGIKTTCFEASLTTETPAYKDFISSYESVHGKKPNSPFYDAITIDILNILDANKSKISSGDKMVQDIKTLFLSGVDGKMARYDFTPDGEVVANDYLHRVEK